MFGMEAWEIALLAVVAYVAVLALIRLMRRHRDALTEEYEQQLNRAKRRTKGKDRRMPEKQETPPAS